MADGDSLERQHFSTGKVSREVMRQNKRLETKVRILYLAIMKEINMIKFRIIIILMALIMIEMPHYEHRLHIPLVYNEYANRIPCVELIEIDGINNTACNEK